VALPKTTEKAVSSAKLWLIAVDEKSKKEPRLGAELSRR
jgi:hypothetical protein